MSELQRFLAESHRRGFDWRRRNCLFWLADWAVLRGRADPARRWRERCPDAPAVHRLVRAAGGLVAIASAGARDAGLIEIAAADAGPGDIAVGRMGHTDWSDPSIGLIRAGAYWAALTARSGVLIGSAEVDIVWRV